MTLLQKLFQTLKQALSHIITHFMRHSLDTRNHDFFFNINLLWRSAFNCRVQQQQQWEQGVAEKEMYWRIKISSTKYIVDPNSHIRSIFKFLLIPFRKALVAAHNQLGNYRVYQNKTKVLVSIGKLRQHMTGLEITVLIKKIKNKTF